MFEILSGINFGRSQHTGIIHKGRPQKIPVFLSLPLSACDLPSSLLRTSPSRGYVVSEFRESLSGHGASYINDKFAYLQKWADMWARFLLTPKQTFYINYHWCRLVENIGGQGVAITDEIIGCLPQGLLYSVVQTVQDE